MNTIKIISISAFAMNAIAPFIFRDMDFKVENSLGWICAIIMSLT